MRKQILLAFLLTSGILASCAKGNTSETTAGEKMVPISTNSTEVMPSSEGAATPLYKPTVKMIRLPDPITGSHLLVPDAELLYNGGLYRMPFVFFDLTDGSPKEANIIYKDGSKEAIEGSEIRPENDGFMDFFLMAYQGQDTAGYRDYLEKAVENKDKGDSAFLQAKKEFSSVRNVYHEAAKEFFRKSEAARFFRFELSFRQNKLQQGLPMITYGNEELPLTNLHIEKKQSAEVDTKSGALESMSIMYDGVPYPLPSTGRLPLRTLRLPIHTNITLNKIFLPVYPDAEVTVEGSLKKDGKLLWTKKWKDGASWELLAGSELSLTGDVKVPEFAKHDALQGAVEVCAEYTENGVKVTKELLQICFVSNPTGYQLYLMNQYPKVYKQAAELYTLWQSVLK